MSLRKSTQVLSQRTLLKTSFANRGTSPVPFIYMDLPNDLVPFSESHLLYTLKDSLILKVFVQLENQVGCLELSKKLAAKGISISYVSTPKNLQRLPPIPSKLQSKINLLEIPLPRVEGLPENCEATIDLQLNQIQFLKKAYDRLAQPFENLMQKVVPDLILFDFAPYWIPEIGAKFGIPTVFFSVYTASAMAFIGPPDELKTGNRRPSPEHFTMPPDWIPFPSLIATRPEYATRMWTSLNFPDASGVSSGQRMAKSIEDCSFVAFRSCDEFEGEYISVVRELYQKPVLPIGVLPPVPFVWILRKPQEVQSSDLLPPGFANRTLSQGIVIQGWVPQLKILAHSAIGGCLFHSGWGTIVESLSFGHPLILLPMIADQGFNAKLLVEKEVGYEVPRNEDGSFSRDIVASSIRLVVVAPEGEKFRLKSANMRRTFDNQGSEDCYINKFIEHLEKYRDLKG